MSRYIGRGGSPEERFWKRVEKGVECWLWTGNRIATGYGNLWLAGRARIYAHRFSYELHHGPIPDGMFVCHACDTPSCVNPAHLFLGDALVNNRDTVQKGRHYKQVRTTCKHGHEYTPQNTRMDWRGSRLCLTCENAQKPLRAAAMRERRRAMGW